MSSVFRTTWEPTAATLLMTESRISGHGNGFSPSPAAISSREGLVSRLEMYSQNVSRQSRKDLGINLLFQTSPANSIYTWHCVVKQTRGYLRSFCVQGIRNIRVDTASPRCAAYQPHLRSETAPATLLLLHKVAYGPYRRAITRNDSVWYPTEPPRSFLPRYYRETSPNP